MASVRPMLTNVHVKKKMRKSKNRTPWVYKIIQVTFKEAARAAPEEMPPRTPSSTASLLAFAMASSDDTVTTSSITDVSRFSGINPGPTPCILCGPGSPPEMPCGEHHFCSFYIFAFCSFRS